MTTKLLATPPWHWWIGVFALVLDVILLIGLGILYYRLVVVPFLPKRRSREVEQLGSRGGDRVSGNSDGR